MLDYERITARDLKRIVNRGEATPAAIGLFVAYDVWRRHAKHKGIVTNELLRWIEAKWRFSAFANELDYWIDLGNELARLVTLVEAQRAMSSIAPLGLQLEIFQMEGSLYATAFKAIHEQATTADLKLKLPGLSANQVERLAELATQTKLRLTPKTQAKFILSQSQGAYTSLVALRNVLQDLATLLGITALPESAKEGVQSIEKSMASHKAYIDTLAPLAPKWAKLLSEAVDIQRLAQDIAAEAKLEQALSLYLTPQWRAWARAGVNLRELADETKGIVELMRQAERAAAELDHE